MSTASVAFGQHPPPLRTLVHLSDTHLLQGNPRLGGRFDTEANLRRTLHRLEQSEVRPHAIVFTGDLTDLGEAGAYTRLREIVEPVARRMDAPLVWVAGNHDERPELRRDLLGLDPSEEPVTGAWDLGGLRLIALDTSVPGWNHGDLDDAQLEWLAAQLQTPAPLGTVLALHHPPLPSYVPLFGILELQRQDRLAEVITGTDVRSILAGHLHYATHGTFAGVPVSVAAATCYTMDVGQPQTSINGMDGAQSFQLVHVYDGTVTHTVVPVDAAPAGDFFSPAWYERMSALTPAERLEVFSRKPPRS
ncbi:metallophosphoesterase [Microbacterium sp. LRZ72]|uniref:metallophosphoesterase n=1 Tax=Microbacterium sp. LRZ72 TaxID=2942481 RepID=UPI0029B3D673|nr:metallophosphoesterase [Microbacterium sp. LRZ72]MDX2377418.1 metallophosphoesterase [Microbacterium sp. LRZ72]